MNTRAKGQRTFAKALRFAKALYPKAYVLPIYQISRWAQPAPFDMLILEFDHRPILVECRTSQWGVSKPQTKVLASLPGLITKEIWLFRRGEQVPTIRRWRGSTWDSAGDDGDSPLERGKTGTLSPIGSGGVCGGGS